MSMSMSMSMVVMVMVSNNVLAGRRAGNQNINLAFAASTSAA